MLISMFNASRALVEATKFPMAIALGAILEVVQVPTSIRLRIS